MADVLLTASDAKDMGRKTMSDKFYITTSIPYVSGAPHVGTAMEFILADTLARYHHQQDEDVLFSTGSDEHGGKIMEKASNLGITPERYAAQMSMTFKDVCKMLDINYDRFVRTTDKQHETIAATIWQKLQPYIYKGSYSGMYDQKEEEFLSLEQAKEIKTQDPERFQRLQEIQEENYFFKLSAFESQIKKLITSGELRITPESREHEILALLNKGLEDVSISRPKSKIPWGITVPGDETQTMYVWFEALMNYITVLGYPDHQDFKKYWPADVQVIGKDISRFHATIWPAMLLGLGLPVQKVLYVHGFITVDGKKMSKSVGNVISPNDTVSTYGSDATRYYLLRHIPSNEDGDFTWEKMEMAYNNELGNDLGNLVQRTSSMIHRYQNGVIGDVPGPGHDTGPYHEAIADFRFDKALDYTWGLVQGLNQYIELEKPWVIAKEKDAPHLQEVLAYVVGSLHQIAGMLYPFMPKTAMAITNTYKDGVVKDIDGSLFPKVYVHTKDKK